MWIPELQQHAKSTPIVLVGTQSDLRTNDAMLNGLSKRKEKPVSYQQAEKLAKQIGAVHYGECSALTQKGLKSVFDEALLSVLEPKVVKPKKTGLLSFICGGHSTTK